MGYLSDIYSKLNEAKTYSDLANTPIPQPSFIDRLVGEGVSSAYPHLIKYRDDKLNQLRDAEFAPVLNQYKSMVDFAAQEDPSKLPGIAANVNQYMDSIPNAAKLRGTVSKSDPQGFNSYTDIMRNYATNAQKQAQVNDALRAYDAGTDTADHRVALTQNYGKDLDNVLKPHAERRAYNQNINFLKDVARIEPQNYNTVSDAVSAYVDAAARNGKDLKPDDIDRYRNSVIGHWEKVKVGGPHDSTINNGPVTETTRLQSYALGKDDNVGAPARYDATEAITANAASRQARAAELTLESEERKSADEKINHYLTDNATLRKKQMELDLADPTDKATYEQIQKSIEANNKEIPKWEAARKGYQGDKKGVRPTAVADRGKVVRTGIDKSGKKVVQYEDGTLEYAK